MIIERGKLFVLWGKERKGFLSLPQSTDRQGRSIKGIINLFPFNT